MFERYSESARRAIFCALTEAQADGAGSIESEHLLLGTLAADPRAAERLLGPSLTPETVRGHILLRSLDRMSVSAQRDLPLSNQCKRVLAYAAEEAQRLEDRHIRPGHLLLGLLREEGCLAADLLRQHGAALSALRTRVAAEPPEPGTKPRPAADTSGERAREALAEDLAVPLRRPGEGAAPPDDFANLLARCNEKARRVIFFARYEGSHFGRGSIEPEHLLLGLLREGLWILYALVGRQTPWHDLIPLLRENLGEADPELAISADMPLSAETQRVLERAAEECDRHGGGPIAVAHLLLALAEGSGSPAALLRERGADPETIRRRIAEFRP